MIITSSNAAAAKDRDDGGNDVMLAFIFAVDVGCWLHCALDRSIGVPA